MIKILARFHDKVLRLQSSFWDLFAKNQKLPLNKLLNDESQTHISVYASGINPSESQKKIKEARAKGIKAFKVKIGFNHSLDIDLLNFLSDFVSNEEMLMLDVNQGWSFEEAREFLKILQNYNFSWIEEPITALLNPEKFIKLMGETNR